MEILNLPISSVKLSPMNPRKTFDEVALQELADNIRQQGLLQPITVRPMEYDDQVDTDTGEITSYPISYEVVCGERRYRACVLNGAGTISAIVREMTDDEAFDAMITENLQRKDVDPIEEAYAFHQLIAKGSSAEEVAARFGKSVRFVQDRVKLNSLNPELVGWVRDGKLPLVSAMIIAKLSDENQANFAKSYAYQSSVSKESALNYVNNLFCHLSNTPWANEAEPFTGGCGVACGECRYNSSNTGCLFYEMKGDAKTAKCTSREKMEQKALAYFIAKLRELDGELVRKGSRIELGKTVLVDEGARYHGAGMHEKALEVIGELGYAVYMPEELGPRCWYRIDDERTKAMLERGEAVRGLSLSLSVSGPGVFTPCVFYTKAAAADDDPKDDGARQAVRLAGKYASVESDVMRPVAVMMSKMLMAMKPSAHPLFRNELAMLAVTVLLEADNDTKKEFGVTDYSSGDAYRRVTSDPDTWGMLLRRWMFQRLNECVTQNWKYSESAAKAINALAEELLPKESEEAQAKAKAEIEKKRAKLKSALEELGYGTDGKLLEYKDTQHYTER